MEKVNNRKIPKIIMLLGLIIILIGVVLMSISKDKSLETVDNDDEMEKIEEISDEDEKEIVEESNDDNEKIEDDEYSDDIDDSTLRIYSLEELNNNRSFDSGIYFDESVDGYSKYYNFYNTYFEKIYKNGSLSASEMTDKMKFFFLSNITNVFSFSKDNGEDMGSSIAESDLKEAYEMIYGKNTYKQISDVTLLCYPFTYDSTNKLYSTSWSGCDGGDRSGSVNAQVIDYQEETDKLTIVTSVIYYSYDTGEYYKDYDMTVKISASSLYDDTIEGIKSYIKENYSNLEQYTYTFKINDGNYIYQGVTRTQSVK